MTIDLERVQHRLERIRQVFVAQMEAWLDLMPEDARARPFVGIAGGEALSPQDMLAEVRDGTEWGERFLDHAIALMAARDMSPALPSTTPQSDDGRVIDEQRDERSSRSRIAGAPRTRAASQ